jgi:hypothetical protein
MITSTYTAVPIRQYEINVICRMSTDFIVETHVCKEQ